MRGITVSVGYDDLLALTVPMNLRHMDEILVVTSPEDKKTVKVAYSFGWRVSVLVTDAFTRYGALFNKGLALEEAFDYFCDDWVAIIDADTMLPRDACLSDLVGGYLHTAPRRIAECPRGWHNSMRWDHYPLAKESHPYIFPGYFHLFHTSDQHLKDLPWYDVTFAHAGGGDGFFQSRWPKDRKRRLPFEVLHLGPQDTNWFGRVSPRIDGEPVSISHDNMSLYKEMKGWLSGDRRLVEQQRKVDMRVDVPGHSPREWVFPYGQ